MPARKAAQPDGVEPNNPQLPSQPARRARRRAAAPSAAAAAGSGPSVGPAAEARRVNGATAPAPDIDDGGAWVEADAVEVHQGVVGRVDAADVRVTQGLVGAARADRISIEMGGLGAAMGGSVNLSQAGAGSILSQHATIEQSVVRTLVAQRVEIRRPSAVLVMIAQRVNGEVRVLLDWRGALAFGVALGIVSGLVGRGRRRR